MPNLPDNPEQIREQWQTVRSIFLSASDLDSDQRSAYLDVRCAGDTALRGKVERLLEHSDQAESFLEVPAWRPAEESARRYRPGDHVTDRFEIMGFLGAGGMGEVYSAFDAELRETVALKVVAPDLSRDPRILMRLRQEILLARKIAHPNVCRVFDIGKDTGSETGTLFVTMELLGGKTLGARLQEGRLLDAGESLALIEQIAEGLDAAHSSGILHRDLKPTNVMLIPQPAGPERAVITDFGLAKSIQTSSSEGTLTRAGELMGTPAYMAPELLTGAAASVASDIYALGVVILEMRSGCTTLADPSLALEPALRGVIARCLSPDPGARYASAGEVATALRQGVVPKWRRGVRLGAAALVLAALVVVSLETGAFRFFLRPLGFPAGVQIMITPTANYTGDPKLDGVTEAFRSQVKQSAVANLWDTARLPHLLQSMGRAPANTLGAAEWREVAMRENVPLIVFSNVSRLGDTYNFRVRTEAVGRNPARPESQWETSTQVSTSAQVFDAVRDASIWLRKIAGETQAQVSTRDRLPQDTTTASWEALALYGRAEWAKDQDDGPQALVLLSEAIQTDPDFTIAHARLGDILMSLGRRREAIAHWQIAVAGASRHHLTLREEVRVRALFAIDAGHLEAAEPPLLRWAQEYPNDYLPLFYLGYVYRMQARLSASVQVLESARRIQPTSYFIPASLARTKLALGDYDAVLRESAELRRLNHGETADQFEGAALLMRKQASEALAIFTRMSLSSNAFVSSAGYLLLARAQAELGHVARAIDALESGVQVDTHSNAKAAKATKLLGLAWLAHDDRRRARAFTLQALDTYAAPETCLGAGTILARLGFGSDAARALARLDVPAGLPAFDSIRLRIQGEIKLAQGRAREAIGDFEAASAMEPPLAPRDYLARALLRAGDPERAAMIYKETLAHPGVFWQNAETVLPGTFLEIEGAYRNVQKQLTHQGEKQ